MTEHPVFDPDYEDPDEFDAVAMMACSCSAALVVLVVGLAILALWWWL